MSPTFLDRSSILAGQLAISLIGTMSLPISEPPNAGPTFTPDKSPPYPMTPTQ
jgi:hypothetical protein